MAEIDKAKEWSDKNELAFLTLLHEKTMNHPQKTPSYKPSDWEALDKDTIAATGEIYGADRLKGKFNRLRIETRLFSELLAHTGVTWDAASNIVHAPEEVWQYFYKKDKRNFQSFRKSSCKYYQLLCEIFNHTTATGAFHYASIQMPPTEEEERELENDFLNGGTAQSSEQGGQKRAASENSSERRAKKDTRYDKVEACLELWSSTLATRAKILEEKAKSKEKVVTSPISDPYSLQIVMEILESMEDVSTNSYFKALEHFRDTMWRQMFVQMSVPRRKQWLEILDLE